MVNSKYVVSVLQVAGASSSSWQCRPRTEVLALYGVQVQSCSIDVLSSPESVQDGVEEAGAQVAVVVGDKKMVREILDRGRPCMVRFFQDGTKQESTMTPGAHGFAMAQFEGEPAFETEVPNFNLLVEKTSNVLKRPAASTTQLQLEADEEDEVDEESAGSPPALPSAEAAHPPLLPETIPAAAQAAAAAEAAAKAHAKAAAKS